MIMDRIATLFGWAFLGFLVMLVIAAAITQRHIPLDDMSADAIKEAAHRATTGHRA